MTSLFGRPLASGPEPFQAERAADIAELYAPLPEDLVRFLSGVAGCSPYLSRLLWQEADWLKNHWQKDVNAVFEQLLAGLICDNPAKLGPKLRRTKARVALLTALGDLGGGLKLLEVTGYLTRFADHAVDLALRSSLLEQVRRRKLPGQTEADVVDHACGVVVLAMGKMGAGELNYSSDIDLIVLFDETRHDPDDYAELRAGFIKATRAMVSLLADITEHGYVFRTDLRLRPDPAVTPVCLAMEPAERYYETLGRTWERAAFIKARACAGDIPAGEAFLTRLQPFIYRRHLDFAALQDAHDMVTRIRDHKGLNGPDRFEGRDIKLGPGGIREIEFFAQTQQLIFGGRKPELRARGTLETLESLAALELLPETSMHLLSDAYIAHRALEHRLQMMDDAQTHIVPQNQDALECVSRLLGTHDVRAFETETLARCAEVSALVNPGQEEPETQPVHDFAARSQEIIDRWAYLPAMNSPRAQEIFQRLRPAVLARISKAADPDEALSQFDAFLSGLPAGVQLFSLFEANAQLLDLLVDICSIAPGLARYLGLNSGVFDAVLTQDFFAPLEPVEALELELSGWLDGAADHEEALDFARKWRKEKSFRVGVLLLRGLANPKEAARSYSAIAEACLRALMPVVEAEVTRRYGPAPGLGAAVIAMGKLGSEELTAASDLDLIVVYDAGGATFTQGPKPLAVSAYFAKFTQALVLALTAPTAQGALYEVDMRLRPSGRKGPVAVSLPGFAEYQKTEAWTWERLALTRARVVCGADALRDKVTNAMEEALALPRARAATFADVADMRRRLADAKSAQSVWDLKSGPGGLLDLELLVQTGLLVEHIPDVKSPIEALPRLQETGFLTAHEAAILAQGFELRQCLQQYSRLIAKGDFDPGAGDKGARDLVLARSKMPDVDSLAKALRLSAEACARVFEERLAAS